MELAPPYSALFPSSFPDVVHEEILILIFQQLHNEAGNP